MQVLIWSYLQFLLIKKIAFQQVLCGLCNEFDSSSFELKVFGRANFRMLTQFLVVYVTSNFKKLLYENFSNIVGRGTILKHDNYISLIIISQFLCNFTLNIGMYTISDQAL